MKTTDLINYSKLNKYFNLSRGTIRKDHIPNKYKEQVNKLINLIKAWENEEPIYTKQEIINNIQDLDLLNTILKENN